MTTHSALQIPHSALELAIAGAETLRNQVAAQRQAELNQTNADRLADATGDFTEAFDELASTALQLVIESYSENDRSGLLIRHYWTLASHDHQIAPIHLTWQSGQITAKIDDGANGHSWQKKITSSVVADLLYHARQAYPTYKAALDKSLAEQHERKIRNILGTPTGWSYYRPLDQINPLYAQLSEIDPVRADRELAHWKHQRITEIAQEHNWNLRNSQFEIDKHHAELHQLDPAIADACLASWNAQVAERQARTERQGAAAVRIIALAAIYNAAYATHLSACADWAQRWTDELWEPWQAWRVRYVPIPAAILISNDDEDSDSPFVHEVVTQDHATHIADLGPGAIIKQLHGDGSQNDFVIGAFLDASPLRYDRPTTKDKLLHHRSIWACVHCWLNIPPFVGRQPDPPPTGPGSFTEYVRQHADLPTPPVDFWDISLDYLAAMTVDEFMDQFSNWLYNNID